MSLVTVICLSVLKYSQQRLVLYWNGEVIRSIKGTHDHIASTPREDAVSCSRVPEATFASRGSRRNLGGQSPLWVKSAVLGVARSLPVYPDQRTSSDRSGWSGSCQNRNWPVSSAGFSFLRNLGWLVAPVCLEASGATKPTISAWSFCDYSLIHPPHVLRTTYYWSSNRSSPRLPRQEVASCSMCRRDISSLRLPVRRRSCTFQ